MNNITTKQAEDKVISDVKNISKASSSSMSWSRFKDPRIVRVSRAFGGKDRHSKVFTVKGLRDRRVRLSVPTAIQLYDLQHRLGLNQPSKVVDWLLNVAKHEIDELPPLQMPPRNFARYQQPILQISNSLGVGSSQLAELSSSNYWSSDTTLRDKKYSKEVAAGERGNEKESWILKRNQEGKQGDLELGHDHAYHQSSSSNYLIPHNSFVRRDPSNLSLSHQGEDLHNFNILPVASTLSMPSVSHQVLVYPQGTSTQSCFPLHGNAAAREFDPKETNFQNPPFSNSFPPPRFTISSTMSPKLFPSPNITKDD